MYETHLTVYGPKYYDVLNNLYTYTCNYYTCSKMLWLAFDVHWIVWFTSSIPSLLKENPWWLISVLCILPLHTSRLVIWQNEPFTGWLVLIKVITALDNELLDVKVAVCSWVPFWPSISATLNVDHSLMGEILKLQAVYNNTGINLLKALLLLQYNLL